MRIAYLSASRIPSRLANSVHVMEMCSAFGMNGHEVELFAAGYAGQAPEAMEFYGVNPSFALRLQYRPTVKVIGAAVYVRNVVKALRPSQIDLLYGRHVFSLAALAQRDQATPVIYESHCRPSRFSVDQAEKRIFQSPNFRRLIVISDALRQDYVQRIPDIPADKIVVAHDAASTNVLPDLDRLIPEDKCRVAYVGHLYPGKGMEIISELGRMAPDLQIDVIGGLDSDINYWRAKSGSDKIVFHGFLPHSQLPALYSKFSIALAPYQAKVAVAKGRGNISPWMSPLKIFEYMAAGLAIVASDLPVIREILVHEQNALLVAPDQPDQWAAAIRLLRQNADLRRKLARNARNSFLANHTWRVRAQRVLEGL